MLSRSSLSGAAYVARSLMAGSPFPGIACILRRNGLRPDSDAPVPWPPRPLERRTVARSWPPRSPWLCRWVIPRPPGRRYSARSHLSAVREALRHAPHALVQKRRARSSSRAASYHHGKVTACEVACLEVPPPPTSCISFEHVVREGLRPANTHTCGRQGLRSRSLTG